jgi:thioredoxin reductase (NADPH)
MISEKDIAFPRLTDAQIASLVPLGRRRAVRAGEVLFAEGDRGFSCYVVLTGAIEMFESSRGDPHIIVVHEAHQFTGDVDLLAGRASVVSARVEDGEVLELSAWRFARRSTSGPSSVRSSSRPSSCAARCC